MAKRSGKNAKVTVGTAMAGDVDTGTGTGTGGQVELFCKSWSVEVTIPALEITQTGGGGFFDSIDGITKLTADLEVVWDSAQSPNSATAPGLVTGTTIPLQLYVNRSDSLAAYNCPNFYIEKGGPTVSVDGVVTYKISGNANGAFVVGAV